MGRHETWAVAAAAAAQPDAIFEREHVAAIPTRIDLFMAPVKVSKVWGRLGPHMDGRRVLFEFFSSTPRTQAILRCKVKLLESTRTALSKPGRHPTMMLGLVSGATQWPLTQWGFEKIADHVFCKSYWDTCHLVLVDTERVAVSDCPIAPFLVHLDRMDADRLAESFAHPHISKDTKSLLSEMIMSAEYNITQQGIRDLTYHQIRDASLQEGHSAGRKEGLEEGLSEGQREHRQALLRLASMKCSPQQMTALEAITDLNELEDQVRSRLR